MKNIDFTFPAYRVKTANMNNLWTNISYIFVFSKLTPSPDLIGDPPLLEIEGVYHPSQFPFSWQEKGLGIGFGGRGGEKSCAKIDKLFKK